MSEIQPPTLKRTWATYMEKCSFGIIPPCMPNNEPNGLRESSWANCIPNNKSAFFIIHKRVFINAYYFFSNSILI